jgi:hypothetical protein
MPVRELTVSGSPDLSPASEKEKSRENPHPQRPQKVGFVSLGCPKNLVDSEVMMGLLARAGAELTRRAEDADVIVVNTCSFIESAQQESVNTILEMAAHKSGGKAKKLVVAGCLVERFRDQIRKDIPEVDAVVGTGELEKILAATGVASAPEPSNSPFVVLPSRPEGASRAICGMARSATCLIIFMMTPRRVFWRRRTTWRISRLLRAATIPAPSALFRNCAGNFVPGDLNR